MEPFIRLTARAIPFGAANVDTDVIIPSRYLKSLSRAGLGKGAFAPLRDVPGNIFDQPASAGAQILIAGANFGCGSSREHAPWALLDMGLRCIIAPSFADIFAGNSFRNGLLLVTLPQDAIDQLMAVAREELPITVDLESQTVTTPHAHCWTFPIDSFVKACLLEGLDQIGITEKLLPDIDRFEAAMAHDRPWLGGAAQR
ncbi:3-isopropylmalate dehydratase small subunit [Thermaurantiacus sp.]